MSEIGKLINILKKEKMNEQTKAAITKLESLISIEKKEVKSLGDVVKAMKSLCFHSLSYCCGSPKSRFKIGKPCLWRDSVLTALGLTQEDFEEFKTACDNVLVHPQI